MADLSYNFSSGTPRADLTTGGWTALVGTIVYTAAGRVRPDGGPAVNAYAAPAQLPGPATRATVGFRKLDAALTSGGLIFDVDPAGTSYYLLAYGNATGTVDLFRINAGAGTQLLSQPYAVGAGQDRWLRLARAGSVLTVSASSDDAAYAPVGTPVTDPSPLAGTGRVGLRADVGVTDSTGAHYASLAATDYVTPGITVAEASVDPRTAGVVLHLTGTATAWSGGTTFAVSGVAGVTKTAQAVADATHATVTLTTGTTAGTLAVSDGTLSATVAVAAYKTVRSTVGGVDLCVLEPAAYTGATPAGLVFFHTGNGSDREVWFAPVLDGVRARLIADGYLLAAISPGLTHWGSPAAVAKYAVAHPYLLSAYSVAGVVLLPGSMGGTTGFQAAADPGTFAGVRGVYAVYPCCDVLAEYDDGVSGATSVNFAGQILAAWGVSDRAGLASAVAGKNPVGRPATDYPPLAYRFLHSPADTVVLKAHNTDPMRALLASRSPAVRSNTLLVTAGEHGDPSNFAPDDVSAFVAAALDTTPPGVPTALAAKAGDTIARLTWTAATGEASADYRVYRSTDGGTTYSLVTTTTGTEVYYSGLTNGAAYRYRVTARDTAGNESAPTAAVTVTPGVPGQGGGGRASAVVGGPALIA